MTVAELIEKLLEIPEAKRKALPVCILVEDDNDDPDERRRTPYEIESIDGLQDREYTDTDLEPQAGDFLQIG